MLAPQREAQRVAQARGDHRVMLAAPAGELQVVALRMIGNLLRDAAGIAPRVRSRPGIEVCPRVSEVVEAFAAMIKRADLN